jgi:hypothetical protein
MRRAPASLLAFVLLVCTAVGACRRRHQAPVEPAPAPTAAPAAADTVGGAPEAARAAAEPAQRDTLPTDDELRAVLDPSFAALGRCLDEAGAPDGGTYTLRFSVWPTGKLSAAEIRGAPNAWRCATDALRPLQLAPWRGEGSMIVSVELTRAGRPLIIEVGDGGSPR